MNADRPAAAKVDAATFERHVLGNGVRVVTAPMPHVQSVICFLMFAAGSRYETRATQGIAHFTEHMFFKGTERRPSARDIAGEIDSIGGEFNAFTGKEFTGYYVKCGAESIDVALDVLVDMVRNSKFDPEEIDREKGVILEELNMYLDTPRDMVDDVYEELLFGDQPLGWMVIGRKESIRAATRETFREYMGTWYTPARLVVGLAGRFDDELLPRLEELVGDLGGAGAPGPPPAKLEKSDSPRIRVHTKPSDQAHVCLGVPSYPLDHPDRYVLHVLTVVLGGGMSSRLFTEVRERRGLAYYIHGVNHSYTDAGTLYSQAGVDINRIDEAVTTIATELRRIAEEPVAAAELEKARNFGKGRFVLQLESPQGVLMFGLRREVLENRLADPAEVLDGLNAVTAEDLQRVAQDVVGGNGLNLAVIGPFESDDRFEPLLQ
jgi:predicted Zn-dependent peptidase